MAFKLISRRSTYGRAVSLWHDDSAGSWKAWRISLSSVTFGSAVALDWDSADAMHAVEGAFMNGEGLLKSIYAGQHAEKLARERSFSSKCAS